MPQNASFPEEVPKGSGRPKKGMVKIISDNSFQPQLDISLETPTYIIESHRENSFIGISLAPRHEQKVTDV